MIHLLITRGVDAPKRVTVQSFPFTIGRGPENALVLNDQLVSRVHLAFSKRDKLMIVKDLDSKNGAFLNGDKIVNSIIQNGDKILIGDTEILFASSIENIKFSSNLLDFNLILNHEKEFVSSIHLNSENETEIKGLAFDPFVVEQKAILNNISLPQLKIKEILEKCCNVMALDNLEQAAASLLKGLNKLNPKIKRGAVFYWSKVDKTMKPIASQDFHNTMQPFLVNSTSLQKVLSIKNGLLIKSSSLEPLTRLVIPMIHHQEISHVIHLEIDSFSQEVNPKVIADIQSFIALCSSTFDSLSLRREIDSMMLGVVETMVATIEAKDRYTVGHSERVCRYSMAIANEMHLNQDVKRMLMISALCHDIGKIGIPDQILKKASSLTADEYQEMKLHPTIGYEIISNLPGSQRFLSGIKHHHEKWDGTGYPDGLAGEDIPFFGRIIAVADVFDAMSSGRSYSGFIDESDAIHKIVEEAELFDPDVLKALVKAYEKGLITLKTSTKS